MKTNKVGYGRPSNGLPMKNSTKSNVKSNSQLSKLSATSKGKAVSKSMPKMSKIMSNSSNPKSLVQKVSARPAIKSLRLARVFAGKPLAKNSGASKMAVTRMSNKKK